MYFFELDKPDYTTDMQDARANPVEYSRQVAMPRVSCPVCHSRWIGSDKIRVSDEVAEIAKQVLDHLGIQVGLHYEYDPDVLARVACQISDATGIPVEQLTPGAKIGPPFGRMTGKIRYDIVRPFPGVIWVKEQVKEALSMIPHVEFAQVHLVPTPKIQKRMLEIPDLWEIVVLGRAWRIVVDNESKIIDCAACHRTKFIEPKDLRVDVTRWDGSDIFHFYENPNIVLVTERVRQILEEHQFTNYRCVPIPE